MMKKNKLYTANKWNKPMLMSRENLFDGRQPGTSQMQVWQGLADNWQGYDDSLWDDKTTQYMNSKNWLGLSKKNNPLSKGNLLNFFNGGASSGIVSNVAGMAGEMLGNTAYSGFSNGFNSGVGSAVRNITSGVGKVIENVPVFGKLGKSILDIGGGVIGGAINGLFGGPKVNEAKLKAAKEGTAAYNNYQSNAATFDGVEGPTAQANVQDAYTNSVFGGGASELNEALKQQRTDARQLAFRSVDNNIHNLVSDQINDALANYSAYGGHLFAKGGRKFRGKKMPYITHYNSYRNNSIDAMRKAGFTDEEIDDWNINVNHTPGYKRLSDGKIATQPVGGVFGGGEFTGSGATERWTPAYRPNSNSSFNEAYDEAREAGAETFMFGDKEYNTLREANPIREFNNRYVGAGRTEETVRQREGYGKDFGPVRGPLAGLPLITYAYGGPMDGAIGYGFMSDYLLSKNKTAENKNQMTNMFMGMPNSMFAFGGDMQTNSADFSTGLVHIDEGGSHSENPNDGVQLGVDSEGTPNLVEEGETVYENYVFSNRILADEATKQMFKLPKNKDITFADISKKLEKEIAERPNDPISRSGFEAQMQTLEEQQERQKSEMEAERARAAFEALSPEEQTAVMQNAAEQEAMAQQQAIEENSGNIGGISPNELQQQMQVSPEEQLAQIQANVSALGGQLVKASDIDPQVNKFAVGGRKAKKTAQKYNKEWFSQMAKSLGISDEEMSKFIFNSADPDANLSAFNQIYRDSQYNKALETYKAGQRQSKKNELFGDRGLYRMSDDGKKVYKAKTNSAARDGWISADYRGQDSFEDDLEHGRYISDEKYQKLSDEEKGKYRRIHEKAGDKMYDFNGKLLEEVQPEGTTADSILDEYDADYNKGFKWDDKDAQALQYPVGMEHSDESYLRYVPALGGAIGLFNDLFSSPDYSRAEGIQKTGQITPMMVKSNFNPTYMTYRPLDIWYGQNALNAQSRATDRALLNSSSPSRMAGLIANGYNSQLASGNLFRQAQEYNDALNKQVITHNSGENKTSAQLDLQGQLANQRAAMEAGMHNARYKALGYQMMDDIDARRNASMNANLTNVLQSIGNIGEEAYDTDRLRWLERTGVLKSKTLGANGGKLKKKKRGLTY